jgi:2-oxoglutarate ferredoxin oxidoreductase subunit alpha
MIKRVLMTGNEAIAEGAIRAGCLFYAGYPITPQNELTAYMAVHMPGAGGTFIQAESEVSAINMVFGSAAAGIMSITSSSSPGISLKQEGISYIAGAELPVLIVNVMRGGPGLGNIQPSQSDYFQSTRGGGHGDYRCLVVAPSTSQEAFDIMKTCTDLAYKYRNPAIILGDGMLGQMMEPVILRQNKKIHRPVPSWSLTGCKGRRPNIVKSFFMAEGDLEKANILRQKKYQLIRDKEQRFEGYFLEDAEIVIIAYGTMARISRSAVRKLRQKGIKAGLIRPITLWPFPDKILKSIARERKSTRLLVVEMSYGQMLEDVKLSIDCSLKTSFYGRGGGGVPEENEIIRRVKNL